MVELMIPVPKHIVAWNGDLPYPQSDRHKLNEAVRETAERFDRARNPLVLVGIEAYRFGLAKEIVKLVEKMESLAVHQFGKRRLPYEPSVYMGV